MSDNFKGNAGSDAIQQEAARWVWKRDRGLTAAEQDEFFQWLAVDPRNRGGFERLQAHWSRTYAMADLSSELSAKPNPDLLEPKKCRPNRRRLWFLAGSLAAAAGIVIAFVVWRPRPSPTPTPARLVAALGSVSGPPAPVSAFERRRLDDGSLVDINRGSVVLVQFTTSERRVILERGEADFTVQKNPHRPFIVAAGNVSVRAIGTAFDVWMNADSVDVLVSEGRVQVRLPEGAAESPLGPGPKILFVEAGQRAVVPVALGGPSLCVLNASAKEIDQRLAWRPRLLDFTDAPLSAIVTEFNRHNTVQLVIADADLESLRVSASFPSDDVDGFVRLLVRAFGVRTERHGEEQIVLRKDQ